MQWCGGVYLCLDVWRGLLLWGHAAPPPLLANWLSKTLHQVEGEGERESVKCGRPVASPGFAVAFAAVPCSGHVTLSVLVFCVVLLRG
jgi:hypothetical protein